MKKQLMLLTSKFLTSGKIDKGKTLEALRGRELLL
jgi:hypothetical protein